MFADRLSIFTLVIDGHDIDEDHEVKYRLFDILHFSASEECSNLGTDTAVNEVQQLLHWCSISSTGIFSLALRGFKTFVQHQQILVGVDGLHANFSSSIKNV